MRNARIRAENEGIYHCMSRIIERRHIFGDTEKEVFRRIMRKLETFCGLKIMTYAIMNSHFHILLQVPEREEVSDSELLKRLSVLYDMDLVTEVGAKLASYRRQGQTLAAEELKEHYTYRMYDLSEFMKSLKQRFSQHFNADNDRLGSLWVQRFKSILVENSPNALQTIGAYIDLNAVRGGLTGDPADYRFCGYGEALGGNPRARAGLKALMDAGSWKTARRCYRQHLFSQGQQRGVDENGNPIRRGFTPKQVQEVIESGGRLPADQILRCRVRYFSDGLVLGSSAFVEKVFRRYRDQFGVKRTKGARPMQYGDWQGLCTMRDVRSAVTIPTG